MKIWKQKLIWLKIFQAMEIQLIECNENISLSQSIQICFVKPLKFIQVNSFFHDLLRKWLSLTNVYSLTPPPFSIPARYFWKRMRLKMSFNIQLKKGALKNNAKIPKLLKFLCRHLIRYATLSKQVSWRTAVCNAQQLTLYMHNLLVPQSPMH